MLENCSGITCPKRKFSCAADTKPKVCDFPEGLDNNTITKMSEEKKIKINYTVASKSKLYSLDNK